MAESDPSPPSDFDEWSLDQKVNYLQLLWDRIMASSAANPAADSPADMSEQRIPDLPVDPNGRERHVRDQGAIDARLRLAAVVDSSDEAIVAKDLDGLIQSWNPAAEHIFGFTAEEAIGQPVTMLIPWDRLEEEKQILEKLKQGEQVHLETVRLTKAGKRINASLTVTPVRDAAGRLGSTTSRSRPTPET